MTLLIEFSEPEALSPEKVGHKFAALARAHRAGFPVPPAFAISMDAHAHFLACHEPPEGLADAVRRVFPELASSEGVAVRSSGIWEDTENQSFAGQYRTLLRVRNATDAMTAIQDCWESAGRYALNRTEGQAEHERPPPTMAVILQRMVPARLAGVAFTRNPVFPTLDEVVIEWTKGSAENLVSGRITPCRAYVGSSVRLDRETLDGPTRDGSPPFEVLERIAALSRRCEALFGKPQDVEWAADFDGRIWLLQSRPITTLAAPRTDVPPGLWTRKIAEDLWADRLTPFLSDVMERNAERFDFSDTLKALRLPTVRPTLAVVDGYLYVNGESLQSLLTWIPAGLTPSVIRSLFPPGFDFGAVPRASWREVLRLGLRLLALIANDRQANPFTCRRETEKRLRELDKRLQRTPPVEATAETLLERVRHDVAIMAELQALNQFPYAYATLYVWFLRWLTVEVFRWGPGSFLQALRKHARNVTVEIERAARCIARQMARTPGLVDAVRRAPADRFLESIPETIREAVLDFLHRYGVRSADRSLMSPRWAEKPEQVFSMLISLAVAESSEEAAPRFQFAHAAPPPGTAPTGFPSSQSSGLSEDRSSEASQAPPLFTRILSAPAFAGAQRYLDLREALRFFLDHILYDLRLSLLALGDRLRLGDQVFFLTLKEVEDLVTGHLSLEGAAERSRSRRSAFQSSRRPPRFLVHGVPVDELELGRRPVLRGVGTSPGRAAGRARWVTDPSAADIERGDILVARHTDPGWTPIFSLVAGVVVEEGGLLNHASIVARELGIPAVVGVREATRRVPDGSSIVIDGSLGIVRLKEAGRAP